MHALVVVPVVALFVLVGHRLITGQINTAGLLRDEDWRISPERVQLLLTTLAGLVTYVAAALSARGGEAVPIIPEIPDTLLAAMGGSHGLYLLRKWFTQK